MHKRKEGIDGIISYYVNEMLKDMRTAEGLDVDKIVGGEYYHLLTTVIKPILQHLLDREEDDRDDEFQRSADEAADDALRDLAEMDDE